jgi:signal transduction histidine kinase
MGEISSKRSEFRVPDSSASGETGELVASFNQMATDIETYERERTVLTAGIAHELRTPLTILKGRLHGLLDGVIDPSSGEAERLLRQVQHLSRFVEDLRILAHADAGELELDLREVDLSDVVRAAVGDLRDTASGVRFSETYVPARVRADPVRLAQIVTNLLTNAIKHTPDQGVIAVSVHVENHWVIGAITDEGPGFRQEDRAKLFIPA